MAGIFPNADQGGVDYSLTTNSYGPFDNASGTSPLYFGYGCYNTISSALMNAIISEIACFIDKGGISYDPNEQCNLFDSADSLFVRKVVTITGNNGLTGGGDLSVNRTIGLLDQALTPGTYYQPVVTVNQQGIVSDVTSSLLATMTIVGQGYFSSPVLDGIKFERYNGTFIWILDQPYVIPSSPLILTPSGYANNTVYYFYVYMSGSTMVLEADVTVPALNVSTGIMVKTGDNTRTLVGAGKSNGSGSIIDGADRISSLSWYNRRRKTSVIKLAADTSVLAGAGLVEVSAGFRLPFLSWMNTEVSMFAQGGWNVTGVAFAEAQLQDDLGSTGSTEASAQHSSNGTGTLFSMQKIQYSNVLSNRYAKFMARCTGGTSVNILSSTPYFTTLAVEVEG